MAILENRIKSTYHIKVLTKKFSLIVRKFSAILMMILSLYMLLSPINKKMSNICLELFGNTLSNVSFIYDKVFGCIEFVTDKLSYLTDLKDENQLLKRQIQELKNVQQDMHLLLNENIQLKEMLSVVDDVRMHYITAKLLTISQNPFNAYAIINAGSNVGLRVNQVVMHEKWLIGRIVDVSDNYARVMLINDYNSRVPVITETSKVKGILTSYNGKILINYLENDHSVVYGEDVITSGSGHLYPIGIPVGVVSKNSDNEVIVDVKVNLHDTRFVNVYLDHY